MYKIIFYLLFNTCLSFLCYYVQYFALSILLVPHVRDLIYIVIYVFIRKFVKIDSHGGIHELDDRDVTVLYIPELGEDPYDIGHNINKFRNCVARIIIPCNARTDICDILTDFSTIQEYDNFIVSSGKYNGIIVILISFTSFKKKLKEETLDATQIHFEDDLKFVFICKKFQSISFSSMKRMSNIMLANQNIVAINALTISHNCTKLHRDVIRYNAENNFGKITELSEFCMVNLQSPAFKISKLDGLLTHSKFSYVVYDPKSYVICDYANKNNTSIIQDIYVIRNANFPLIWRLMSILDLLSIFSGYSRIVAFSLIVSNYVPEIDNDLYYVSVPVLASISFIFTVFYSNEFTMAMWSPIQRFIDELIEFPKMIIPEKKVIVQEQV